MLLIDFLGFKQKQGQDVSIKQAAYWSVAWVSVAALFGGGLWLYLQLKPKKSIRSMTMTMPKNAMYSHKLPIVSINPPYIKSKVRMSQSSKLLTGVWRG
jgi:hypothetical protein